MNNALFVKIRNSFNNNSNKMSSITLKVASLLTDTVKQLSAKSKIGDQVYWTSKVG
jgi:hypothetical protein